MKVKRFLDKDSRSAMKLVKAQWGSDAVILSSRRIDDQFEVVAAIDFDQEELIAAAEKKATITSESSPGSSQEAALKKDASPKGSIGLVSSQRKPVNTNSIRSNTDAAPTQDLASQAAVPENEVAMQKLQSELTKLRGMLEQQLTRRSWKDSVGRAPVKSSINQRLAHMGLSRMLSGFICDGLGQNGTMKSLWPKALDILTEQISVNESGLLRRSKISAVIGSTGVGKTSTVAKLAAQAVLKSGRDKVAVISMDSYRIGGQEQLAVFADCVGIPMAVAADTVSLAAALTEFSDKEQVFIDTAGMSQRDERLQGQLDTLSLMSQPIDIYLVLSAAAQASQLRESIHSFSIDSLCGAIITKLDEASELGGVLDALIKAELPVAMISSGQRVPDDLLTTTAQDLVDRAVQMMETARKYESEHEEYMMLSATSGE